MHSDYEHDKENWFYNRIKVGRGPTLKVAVGVGCIRVRA